MAGHSSFCLWICSGQVYKLSASGLKSNLFEEVVAFVVNEDECREVLYTDFPDCLHSEFRILDALDALDVVLSKDSSRTSD